MIIYGSVRVLEQKLKYVLVWFFRIICTQPSIQISLLHRIHPFLSCEFLFLHDSTTTNIPISNTYIIWSFYIKTSMHIYISISLIRSNLSELPLSCKAYSLIADAYLESKWLKNIQLLPHIQIFFCQFFVEKWDYIINYAYKNVPLPSITT